MAYAPTQPVGGRLRFPPPPQSHLQAMSSPSPFSTAGIRGRSELLTPTRQGAAPGSPFRTSLRNNSNYEAESSANPFTPRVERGLAATGSRTFGRRNTLLGTAARGVRASDQGGLAVADSASGFGALPLGHNGDYAMMGGSVGAWPADSTPAINIAGSGAGAAAASDTTIKSPFGTRPKSPAQRSASPRRRAKLPSFLLGSTAQLSRSPAKSAAYASDAMRAPTTPNSTTTPMFGMASPKPQTPLTANPISPRRLSGFGSNDMLSSAYMSSMAPNHRGAALTLDDAPPTMTLDDMDMEPTDPFVRATDGGEGDADPFAPSHAATRANVEYARQSSEDGVSSEDDYNDVKIRSVVVKGLPAETESSALNHFRGFGEILAFTVVPAIGLALLYAEPWQAQRAISQADSAGRILIGGRTLAAVLWADETSIAALFAHVFPGRPLPSSAVPPAPESFTLAETIYAQSPQARAARQPPQQRVGSRLNAVQMADTKSRPAGASPFKQHQSHLLRGAGDGSSGSTLSASGATYSTASALRAAPTVAPRPRNGLLQSAIDILFGW